jgi:hypothetical protein
MIQRNTPSGYERFIQPRSSFGYNGAQLEWESPGPSCAVDFLGLHIKLNPNGSITTRKYIFSFAHLPLCSLQASFTASSMALYIHCSGKTWSLPVSKCSPLSFSNDSKLRGHATSKLATLKAATGVDPSLLLLPKPPATTLGGPRGTCFLGLPCHPQDAPWRRIQQLFANICLPAFQVQAFDIDRLIIAYSRAWNISDIVQRNHLGVSVDTTKVSGSAIVPADPLFGSTKPSCMPSAARRLSRAKKHYS